jgi:hypothetical protein
MTVDRFEVLGADERVVLDAVLDFHRDAVIRKTSGLRESQLRKSPVPSGSNLLGLVYHLKRTEEWWFEGVFEGRPFDGYPPQEHAAPPGAGYAETVESYREQCERSRGIARNAQLDDVSKSSFMQPTLRWLLVHMIEETARHNGHADILRELLDGQTGE